MSQNIFLSIIIPVYNEEGAVEDLHSQIVSVCQNLIKEEAWEIIFINDGSEDKTLDVLKRLSPVKIVDFRRNFGQTAALDAGIKLSQGKYIIAMDGDGQNDPADIPHLLHKLEGEGWDAVSGWRQKRKDSIWKNGFSRGANFLRKIFIDDGVHDSGCTLKIYKRECFKNIDLTGEVHRFIPALLKVRGFKVGELVVRHHKRRTGKTKYNWKRGVKGLLDILSIWFWKKYANRPLHLFGSIGIFLLAVSVGFGLWASYKKIFLGISLSDTVLTDLTIAGFLIGIQFFLFALLADIVSKIYYSTTKDSTYDIKEVIDRQ